MSSLRSANGAATAPRTTETPKSLSTFQTTDSTLFPGGDRSLSNISSTAFSLGLVFSASLILGFLALQSSHPLWRLAAFTACLGSFHFLEFWAYAHYNTPNVRASSFLLFNNGAAYNVAYASAALEIVISHFLFPSYQVFSSNSVTICAGLVLVVIGQATRSAAIATAGSNFNHIVQKVRKQDHVLVTDGVYAWVRHPSYFGFFWWALGTQLVVGNKVCLVAYAYALWGFFSNRIRHEEQDLLVFFGTDFEEFKARTRTGIPFIP